MVDAIGRLLNKCPEGPRIEIGVHRGTTLKRIANHDGLTIGVDSFCGMPEPGKYDFHNGECNYPKGRLASNKRKVQLRVPMAKLIKGYAPYILSSVYEGPYAFAHLDIDHYQTTYDTLKWLFPRMMPGGILCCDDWFEGRKFLAAR